MQRNDEGVLVFNFRDAADRKEAFSMLMESPVGVEYLERYDPIVPGDEHSKLVAEAVDTLWPNNDAKLAVAQLATALRTLIKSGAIKFSKDEEDEELPEPAEPAVDLTPRDRNGVPLNSSQILWKSFREWSDSHSSSECRARARSDEQYGNFYRKNLEREFAEQPVGDAVIPEGAVPAQTRSQAQSATPELVQFAQAYSKEPVSNLKPRGGFVSIGGQPMPWATYQDLLNKAIASGVIR